ncbi:MAG: class I adenylate-forming enzyme family protein [Saprospiraceae bacterium]
MPFYKNKTQVLTYADLRIKLNALKTVDTIYYASEYPDFIVNVIAAIVNDIDITLIDYRNTKNKNSTSFIPINNSFETTEDIISKITTSTATVGIYSSGTEGPPKLIKQPISRLMKSVRIEEKYLKSTWAFTYNPSHSAGIQMFLQVISNQSTLVDMYRYSRKDILENINDNNIDFVSATPTFYRMLAPYDFACNNVKSATLNGEKSTPELVNNVANIFPNAIIRNIYGSTESGPLMSSTTSTFEVPKRLIGKIKIQDDVLFIASELISNSIAKGDWYDTGDLVKIISEHPLTIEFVSRKTRIINVGGHNVNPQEVEEVLLTHPAIKDIRVYGRPNKMIGNLIIAEVLTIENSQVSEKEIIQHCKKNIAQYKIPRIIKFVEKIAIGNTGKKRI